jgi:2-furoyl-CoA dehydrogenase large subunit
VVARDRYVAEDTLELIDVDYEPLEPELDPERGEVVSERTFSYGDPDGAVAADVVVRGRFSFPRWTCAPLETYGVVAE